MSDTPATVDGADEESAELDPDAHEHLENVDDGCGCAEVWEELSDQREERPPD